MFDKLLSLIFKNKKKFSENSRFFQVLNNFTTSILARSFGLSIRKSKIGKIIKISIKITTDRLMSFMIFSHNVSYDVVLHNNSY